MIAGAKLAAPPTVAFSTKCFVMVCRRIRPVRATSLDIGFVAERCSNASSLAAARARCSVSANCSTKSLYFSSLLTIRSDGKNLVVSVYRVKLRSNRQEE